MNVTPVASAHAASRSAGYERSGVQGGRCGRCFGFRGRGFCFFDVGFDDATMRPRALDRGKVETLLGRYAAGQW